jgi:hypothetical protein
MIGAWIKQVLTGADNSTLAIGRVVALILCGPWAIYVPLRAVWSVATGATPASEWATLLPALSLFLVAVIGALGALIAGTAFTEPRAGRAPKQDDQDHA